MAISNRNRTQFFILAVFGIWLAISILAHAQQAPKAVSQPLTAAKPAIPVTTQLVSQLAYYPAVEAPASVLSLQDSKISAEINGKIVGIEAQVGDTVKEGSVLFRLDRSDYEIAAQRANANLQALDSKRKLAKSKLDQVSALIEQNFVSREMLNQRKAEYDGISAEYAAQQAELAGINRNLQRTTIRAPFTGIVKTRVGQLGEYVTPGQVLANLVGSDKIEVSAQIQQNLVDSVKNAKTVTFVAHEKLYPLKLRALTPLFDQRERSMEARFTFEDAKALPGESGVIKWQSGRPVLPAQLLVQRGTKRGVFIREGNRAKFIEVPNAETGRPVPATLPNNIPIIIEGRFGVNDGDIVK